MTPMTASFTDITDETLLRPVLAILGLEGIDKHRLMRLIAGRLYFNASMGLAIIRHLPGDMMIIGHWSAGDKPSNRPIWPRTRRTWESAPSE